jgi:general secretion pathway protein M
MPIVDKYVDNRGRIQDLYDQLTRYRMLAAEEPAVRERLEAFKQRNQGSELYLKGETPTLAGAELQERVKSVVESSGGTLVSTQTMPEAEEQGLVRVSVKVRMRADVEGVQKVLYGLETGRPLVFLENVLVRSRVVRRRGVVNISELDVSFDVTGYMHAGQAA